MKPITTNKFIDESNESQALKIDSNATQHLDLMMNVACKPIIQLLNTNEHTLLTLDKYNQISAILFKFASSNKQIIDAGHNTLIQTSGDNESLFMIIDLSIKSFVHFLNSYESTVFTLNEYTQIANIIHKFICVSKQLPHSIYNMLAPFFDETLSIAMASFIHFCQTDEFKDFDLERCYQIASITHKLASANTQFVKNIKKHNSFHKEAIQPKPIAPIDNEVQSCTFNSDLSNQKTNSQTPPIEVPFPPSFHNTTSIHNKKLSRKLRKKLLAQQVAKRK